MDAKLLAEELTPKMRYLLEQKKPDLLEQAGSWIARKAMETAWPMFIRMVPHLLESGIELIAWRFGKMTMEEVVDSLLNIRNDSPTTGSLFHDGDGGQNHSNVWM